MNKTILTAIAVAIVFGAGGYYFGSQQSSATVTTAPTGASGYTGRTGGRFAGAGGGFNAGTIISTGDGTMTIQLTASTSTSAVSGTKIVLFDNNTQVNEMQTVPASTLTVGQNVVVNGSTNTDGSLTATTIQVRPTGAGNQAGIRTSATGQ